MKIIAHRTSSVIGEAAFLPLLYVLLSFHGTHAVILGFGHDVSGTVWLVRYERREVG